MEDEEKIIPTKYEGLLQLAKLKEKGLLSEEEFDKEKRNLYNLETLWGDGIIKDIKSKK